MLWLGLLLFLLGVWAGRYTKSQEDWRVGVLSGYTYAVNRDRQTDETREEVSGVLCDHGLISRREKYEVLNTSSTSCQRESSRCRSDYTHRA